MNCINVKLNGILYMEYNNCGLNKEMYRTSYEEKING